MWASKFHSLKDCVGSIFVSDPATSISFKCEHNEFVKGSGTATVTEYTVTAVTHYV